MGCCCCNINCNVDVNKALSTLWLMMQSSRPNYAIKKLEKMMGRLGGKRNDIKNQINDAKREAKIPTDEVIQWLGEVEVLEGQVAVIKHDLESMSYFSCNCFHRTGGTSSQTQQKEDITVGKSSNCCSIIIRTAERLGDAEELMKRAGELNPIVRFGVLAPTLTLSISHQPPVGIQSYVDDIVGYIDGGEVKIIGIYGMGGVGKTLILDNIERHYLEHSVFDHVIPVRVGASQDNKLKKLQLAIADRLNLKTLEKNDDEQTCGGKLCNHLKDKKCLLLLDGIWGRLDLQLLGMTTEIGQQQQSRKVVVLTTRSETVCQQMQAKKKIKVNCLKSDEAWKLFKQNSDADVLNSDAEIMILAAELAKECAGLPLALVTVARAMSRTDSLNVWKHTLREIKDKHEWTKIGIPEEDLVEMYNVFKLSYDNLEKDSMRECLMCCALWSAGYEIHEFDDLIPCWIGCGIIRKFNVINDAFGEGYFHLEALMAASLLEHSSRQQYHFKEKHVTMHKVIRDMALLMVSGWKGTERKWIVKAGNGLKLNHLPIQEEWQEVERASFMKNNITSLQEYEASTFSKLSMLILLENSNLKTIPPSLSTVMPHLTYLDITFCDITELPMEIGKLTKLQYLNLSSNPITRLPAKFGCLSKLEYLLLRNTKINIVPNGTINKLSMLKWLDIQGIYPMSEWWWDELKCSEIDQDELKCSERDQDELKCSERGHQLSVAINIYATTANIERLDMLQNVSIWDLTIDGDDASELPNLNLSTQRWSYNISDNLESLDIKNVGVVILMLTSGVGHESSFRSLQKLSFHNLQLLEEISLNGVKLNYLRELNILKCPKLKNISWVLQLPCLSVLMIEFCSGMKELITEVGKSDSKSSIRSLTLLNMSNLNCIANQTLCFSNLEYIHVVNCPELKKLSFDAEILKSKLKEIRCDETWWRNLDWDYKSHMNSLKPHFIPKS